MVDFLYIQYMLTDPDDVYAHDFAVLPDGGIGVPAEFASSFETKANVSGALNPLICLPNAMLDPIVYGEGFRMTFTNYLRQTFRHGGFLGIPRQVRHDVDKGREVFPNLFLPDHPIFATLAQDLEPF